PELPLKRSFFPAETASRLCAPQNRGYSSNHGKSRLAWDCMVVDAAWIEPVSDRRFPDNREINREFCKIRPSASNFDAQLASRFSGLPLNSLRMGTGNFRRANREYSTRNREFSRRVQARHGMGPSSVAARQPAARDPKRRRLQPAYREIRPLMSHRAGQQVDVRTPRVSPRPAGGGQGSRIGGPILAADRTYARRRSRAAADGS